MGNHPKKILIVEDESSIRRFISINLQRDSFTVIEAASGEEGLEKTKNEQPNLVVLDVMLPGIDGYEVCRRLREEFPHVAVIMLTARGQDMDKLMGLELGADDYIVKPFNPLELSARIRAVLRRMNQSSPSFKQEAVLQCGPFQLDTHGHRFVKDDRNIELTPREFDLLKTFMKNIDKALTRDEILNMTWGVDFIGDPKTVDVHIRRLREKIEDTPSHPVHIETVWGYGYCFRKGQSNVRN
ncbi:response regulator transcription factor [Aneurinibacillus aneurinilyticus]|uniref:response regulator transcription factor n=1 Tax=Aneurinibacillus aneurinilyticus TaxID=1391 RepID=UPI0023F2F378|nr:response regulator transcription factor [Aneurinibacillus aneurinilyticus]MED0672606.1 response regulator transcription factor [Aneurinibacillus aneurinilyticus]